MPSLQSTNPASIAEQTVIGCILLDSQTISIAREILKQDDFFTECNQKLFSELCALSDEGVEINVATLFARVMNNPQFNEAGGISYLSNCQTQAMSANNIEQSSNIVRNDSIKRKLSRFADSIKSIANSPVSDIDGTIATLSQQMLELSTGNQTHPWVSALQQVQEILRVVVNEAEDDTLHTGFVDLDRMFNGFRRGELTIIAARPAMGKTAMGLNIMLNVARTGAQVAFFTLEMTAEEIGIRCLSNMASINGNSIRRRRMTEQEWQRFFASAEQYGRLPIQIDETPAIDVATIRERARRIQTQYGLRMIIMDYLQLARATGKDVQGREQMVAAISRTLKAIAKELHIPVLALAQLNRANETRTEKRPVLSDLRDSGSIEQDADNVIFLHREDYYHPNEEQTNTAEIIVSKQRSGATGVVRLHWSGEFTRFSNLEE